MTYEGENKGREGVSENIAYAFCLCEPLDEAKQSLSKASGLEIASSLALLAMTEKGVTARPRSGRGSLWDFRVVTARIRRARSSL